MVKDKNKLPACRFTDTVVCTEERPQCQKCGWNPKVAQRRKKKGVVRRGQL